MNTFLEQSLFSIAFVLFVRIACLYVTQSIRAWSDTMDLYICIS